MKKIIFIALIGYIWPLSGAAQNNHTATIEKYMNAQVNIKEFSGVVLVSEKGKIIYHKAFGYADLEWNLANTLNSKFEIGSLTKQFTAAAILQLAEQRKLNLNDPLSAYFPGYPKGDSVTLDMLLNHTSGIADYTGLPSFYPLHTLPLAKDSVIALFKNQPYMFAPGTKWKYSNSGYFLLGCIIEKVSKQTYGDFLKNNILNKASMVSTGVNHIDSILAFRVKGYSRLESGAWRNAEYFSMEIPFSAGSLISTAQDLYLWQNALQKGKIISKESLAKMTIPYLNHYGYGLIIDSMENHRRISHSGAIPGYTSYMGNFPNEDISIIILSNNDSQVGAIAGGLSSILFNFPFQMPYIPKEVIINYAVLKNYVGKYQLAQPSGSTNFELIEEVNKLYLKPEGSGDFKMELKPESETKFFFARDQDQQIEFVTDPKSKIIKYYFINKGMKLEIKKIN